ncbi:MAG: ABC transporter ATP-binding protein [Candidatus Bathyarchaeia archaeon]
MTKSYGRIPAVDRVSFEVKDGEYLCVLGPTGSGKTTLLRLIAGLIYPDQGEVLIDGKPVTRKPPEERDAVYVPQQYALFPHMRVLENVSFGPLSKGLSREAASKTALEMLQMVRLDPRADAFPRELSGGMQQRVALARGLASGARLLLLDEPLGALDARLRVELRYKLKELAKSQGLTTLHVTHDQEEAVTIGDRMIVLRHGRVQQHGTPFHVYQRPASLFVADFIGGANFLEGLILERTREGSTVRLRGGLQVQVEDTTYAVDEPVVVMVREERMSFTTASGDLPNALRGEVKALRFLGSFMRFEVRLENGDEVACKCPTARAPSLSVGEKVAVSFTPGDALVYSYPPVGLRRELEVV